MNGGVATGARAVEAAIPTYDQRKLLATTEAIFLAIGSQAREAGLIADHLVGASLTGHDSHGVGLIPGYVESARRGDLILNQELRIFRDTGAICICDAHHGAGQVMAHDAMVLGIERARTSGSCIVGLRDSYHIGRIGHWAEQCAAAGLVSIHFVNVIADPMVAPFGGKARRLGTNPFAAGFPSGDGGPPVVVDFATSVLAFGKVRVANNKGVPVPEDALMDAEGRPTTDPSVMFTQPMGALLPFGKHKGSALSLACELLGAAVFGATVLAGPPEGRAVLNSMFSVLVDPAVLDLGTDYAVRRADVAAWFGSEAGVRLPGEPERETRAERMKNGIPVDDTTMSHIIATAEAVGIGTPDLSM